MADDPHKALAEARAEIERLHAELESTNKGTLAIYTELDERAENLRRIDERKDAFIALLGHELRNPLAAAMMASENLSTYLQPPPAPVVAKALTVLDHQLERLAKLVDDLLDLARITRGKVNLERQRFDLRSAARNVVAAMRPIAEEAGHRLDANLGDASLFVEADAARIEQVIGNLLDNACRYTPAPGHIEVRAAADGDGVRVDVVDDGRGLDPDQIETLFTVFEQGHTEHGSSGGLGLGLALVRSLMELHGGRSTATSPGVGAGSTFSIWLPSVEAPEAEAAPTPRDVAADPASVRVLLVEDNEDLRELLAMGLRARGYEVEEASSGPEALELDGAYDLGIFDVGLPGMSGHELAQTLLRNGRAPRHLVAMSGFGTDADKARSHEAGFAAHLVKPVSLKDLQAQISALGGAAGGERS